MLIVTKRHRAEDLRHWHVCSQIDELNAKRMRAQLSKKCASARDTMINFIHAGDGYLGVSWGKDSIVCAWLLSQIERETDLSFPVVWVRIGAWQNPDSYLVRDAFLARWPLKRYVEIEAQMGMSTTGRKEERLVAGFREAAERFGERYISGVRADEGMVRSLSIGHHGLATARVCRPIGRWRTEEVFALIHREELPLHPVYGYTLGGMFDRMRLRTANIGGIRGTGHGRREWEQMYYPDVWSAAARAGVEP